MRLGRAANWSVQRMLWACFLPLVAVLIIMALVSIWQFQRIDGEVERVVDVRRPLETTVLDMRIAAGELEQAVSAYIVNRDVAQANRAQEAEDEFGRLAAEFSGLAETDEEQQVGQDLVTLHQGFKGSSDEIARVVDQQHAALSLFRDEVGTISTLIDETLRATDVSSPDAGKKLGATLDILG